jgi:hypothetical protein
MAHYKGAASEAGRAIHLMKKREKAQQEIEFRKKKIEEDLKISNIENKFAAHYDAVEQQLKVNTFLNNFRLSGTINKYLDSSVGIATHYGLDSPRIESRWG